MLITVVDVLIVHTICFICFYVLCAFFNVQHYLCGHFKINTCVQGRIKTKLGLMLLPGKGPIFFPAFKTDQEVQDP